MALFAFYLTRRRRQVLGWAVLLTLALAAAPAVGQLLGQAERAQASSPALQPEQADQNASRVAFLEELGWQVEQQPAEAREVVIPLEFDQLYRGYNQLQLQQGFDLTPYRGRRVMCYSYRIGNHPTGETEVRANLLVCRGRLVGGDVCSLRLEGFMHGLAVPGQEELAALPTPPGMW